MEIRFQKNWAIGEWEIFAFERIAKHGRIPYRITIEKLKPIHEHERMNASAFVPVHEAAQFFKAIVEALEEAELMPRGTELAGELKASKIHLEDMRKLVFDGREDDRKHTT